MENKQRPQGDVRQGQQQEKKPGQATPSQPDYSKSERDKTQR